MLQRIETSGWPLLLIDAWNGCVAPSSTPLAPGVSETAMSLRMVIVAEACLVASVTLCAVTVTVVDAERICGAVYTPFALMVPVNCVPPATPLTLHDTVVSLAPVTVGVKACVLPKSSEAVAGVTVTPTAEIVGVGGGGTAEKLVTPLPQPTVNPLLMRRARTIHSQERDGGAW
jgi:hypothetical protein